MNRALAEQTRVQRRIELARREHDRVAHRPVAVHRRVAADLTRAEHVRIRPVRVRIVEHHRVGNAWNQAVELVEAQRVRVAVVVVVGVGAVARDQRLLDDVVRGPEHAVRARREQLHRHSRDTGLTTGRVHVLLDAVRVEVFPHDVPEHRARLGRLGKKGHRTVLGSAEVVERSAARAACEGAVGHSHAQRGDEARRRVDIRVGDRKRGPRRQQVAILVP